MLILTGARPASIAASIPSRTRATGKSIPFIAPNTASSSESRLTVTRCSPAVGQRAGQRPQRGAVGRQGQVELAAVGSPERRQHRDQVGQVAADERLAAGDPQLLDAERDERPGRPLDLLEAQDLVARQERVVLAEDLLGHAVGAPEVAAIGDRDAQVAHRPAERVGRSGSAIEGRGGVHRAHGSPEARADARRYHRVADHWYH